MQKIHRLISLLLLLFLILLCSCSKNVKETNKDREKADPETGLIITSLFDEFTDNLDGANTEKYAADLYDTYLQSDSMNFIHLLSQQKIYRIKPIADLLASEAMNISDSSSKRAFATGIRNLLDQKDLTELEEYTLYELYARILYYSITL